MSQKDELVRYYSWLRKYGYNDSHSGNASGQFESPAAELTGDGDKRVDFIERFRPERQFALPPGQFPVPHLPFDQTLHVAGHELTPRVQVVDHPSPPERPTTVIRR